MSLMSAKKLLMVGKRRRTYAEFSAHIDTLRNRTANGSSILDYTFGAGRFRVNNLAKSGDMAGTPFKATAAPAYIRTGNNQAAALNRIVQHALPSLAKMDEQIANGGSVFLRLTDTYVGGFVSFPELNRNGYNSTGANTSNIYRTVCSEVIFWDFSAKKAFRSDPSTASVPVEYEF